ncbi:ribbon-helix-helix domain-containing protein [Helicobacter pylori]|uniref:ribbon-helix-helix domain-containing protein n=1 Tax=Helicobacter pylori TaxID=210 RepID=UPI0034664E18|nr:ribbon-helix-helix domain-containing protein [Helicobacter pylori]WQX49793.1 ribbon-helix-helix domain-containing protein [Helicobacter pylori]
MELGNKNIKPGRKRVAVDELKRNFSVTFYLSKDEHDVLRRLADEEVESVNSFVKRHILKTIIYKKGANQDLFVNDSSSRL